MFNSGIITGQEKVLRLRLLLRLPGDEEAQGGLAWPRRKGRAGEVSGLQLLHLRQEQIGRSQGEISPGGFVLGLYCNMTSTNCSNRTLFFPPPLRKI